MSLAFDRNTYGKLLEEYQHLMEARGIIPSELVEILGP